MKGLHLKPLSLRECLLLDLNTLAEAVTRDQPEADNPVALRHILAGMTGGLLDPSTGPPGISPRVAFPIVSSLYPEVPGNDTEAVRAVCVTVLRDLLVTDSLVRGDVENAPAATGGACNAM